LGTGNEELLLASDTHKAAESWSPDGALLAFNSQTGNSAEVWLLSINDPAHKAAPFRQARLREQSSAFSPDGKFIAYRTNDSGRNEIFVQCVAPNGGRWQISTEGGEEPSWRRDGKELYYICQSVLMAVDVQVKDGALVAGLPHPLFSRTQRATAAQPPRSRAGRPEVPRRGSRTAGPWHQDQHRGQLAQPAGEKIVSQFVLFARLSSDFKVRSTQPLSEFEPNPTVVDLTIPALSIIQLRGIDSLWARHLRIFMCQKHRERVAVLLEKRAHQIRVRVGI
jgi:hypothetical protein